MLTNSIHRTKIVSFPRSGHHLLIRGLQAVFESELVYSEFYKSEHNMDNCPFVNVQKSHDFNLDEVIDPEMRYVVLYRDKDDAIKSWYNQSVTFEGFKGSYLEFRKSKDDFYNSLLLDKYKWGKHNEENIIKIDFNDFVENKFLTVLQVCNFISTKPLTPYQIIAAKAWEKRESLGY